MHTINIVRPTVTSLSIIRRRRCGDGQDTINDYGYVYSGAHAVDKVVFGAGIMAADIAVSRSGYHLVVKIKDPANAVATDQITIENWFNGDVYRIESLNFADNTSLTKEQLHAMALVLTGTEAADTLDGSEDSDAIKGLGGNDTIKGNGGNDTIEGGAGNDTITDTYGNDTIDGGEGDDVITDQGGGTNVLRGGAGNDTITFSYSGQNTIDGSAGDDLIKVDSGSYYSTSASYTHTITAGTGNDRIQSDGGANTYMFSRGDGQDTISDYGYVYTGPQATDKVVFGAGITAADIAVSRSGYHLVVKIKDPANAAATDQITIENWFNGDVYRIESLNFTDGTSLTKAEVHAMALVLTGTEAADTLSGWEENNTIYGYGGNDTIVGGGGNDILQGGAGNDSLTVASGNILFNGGAGNDAMTGGSGNELFIGGKEDDTIGTGTGSDVIAFNRGDGMDLVTASTGMDNTVSLGGGILYADLLLKKSANDLILVTGTNEQLTFKDWYASTSYHSVANLQVVVDGSSDHVAGSASPINDNRVERFNFDGLVSRFDQARAADSNMTAWSLSSSLLDFHLGGSDTAAIGGDLAYQYANAGNLSNLSIAPAQAVLADTGFGKTAQNLQGIASPTDQSPRLV